MKELEQKLELERSTARRHEAQINRLRHQLERAQEEKNEDVSHKNSDALRRMQKQLRDLRNDLQEAERREQDTLKKKRNAVSEGWYVYTLCEQPAILCFPYCGVKDVWCLDVLL